MPQLDWGGVAPFVVLTLTALGILVFDLLLAPRHKVQLTYLGLMGVLVTLALLVSGFGDGERVVGDMLILDDFSRFFHVVFLLITAFVLLVSVKDMEEEKIHQGEYYALILFATLGMMVMASATDLIMLFLGLEALSIPLYILSGFLRRHLSSNESALKYLLLGAFASAFLLYGIAFLYGSAGSTRLARIAAHLSHATAWENPLVFLGVGLLLVGLAFKVAAVPFHMWLPDVYEGAPTSVTAFMIAGTKAAAFSGLLRAFGTALTPLPAEWVAPLWILALLTMGVGNVAALTQQSIKR
ncbi:MAG: NADH-quinone oxidoreductase subunit N, partial [Candidatus Methylomirabilales bacterium]